ncbi:hypothetical protein OJAV_G00092040 [Oryzias javanicus]|uniref:Uncharacterized protein n=1 Tax=Oryzias javanicus TaxID=123683 RepID=A0A3S2M5T3_ORYJA|nr:hypothetical protein OJAV_G00092040 [Oryzias javanicus]
MRPPTVTVCLSLLALCCLMIPRGGETAGKITFLQQPEGEKQTEEQKSLDDPDGEQALAGDPHPLGSSIKARADSEGAAQAGLLSRVRRAPDESKKKKKKDKKNKDPSATKKPKSDKKGKKKVKQTTTPPPLTTTLPPTTTTLPTEPPEVDYFPEADDYWKSDYDLWGDVSTPSAPQAETFPTSPPYDYWNPVGEDTVPPVIDGYDDYWKPEEIDPPSSYSDTRKQDEKEPYHPATDNYDNYYRESDPTPSSPEASEKTGKDDSDYWEATYEVPDNARLPDGKGVSPDVEVEEVFPEDPTPTAPFEKTWYDDYDNYGVARKEDEVDEKWMEKERERAKKERERQERERAQRLKEAEERARNRPRIYKEPKKCPPLGMESHKIESDQLSASSMSHYRFAPQRARLNMQGSDEEDSMRGGAWCANSEDTIHWFEIDARKETEFTGVITQGRDSLTESDFVLSYFLAFSNDSREWTTIHDGYADWLFFANSDKDTPVMNRLAVPVVARYIRIIPQSWNGSLCMRLEVLGCPLPDPSVFLYRQNEVTPVDYLQFRYHNYSEMIALMKSVNDECPNITSIYSLGRSAKGRELMAMVLSGNPTEHEIGEPELRLTAGLHGNEAVGREMLLLLMQYVCKEYKDRNPRAQRLVEGIRIHLVPSLNPDGQETALEVGSELSSWTTGHFTEDGFDIFQNFPDLNNILWEAEDKGKVPKLTPNHHVPIPEDYETNATIAVETKAIISWMKSHPFVLGVNFQGGESLVAYPYDNLRLNKPAESQKPHRRNKRQYEDEDFDVTEWGRGHYEEPEDWRSQGWLAISYASTHLTMTHNHHGSCHGDARTGALGIINRAKWKPVSGSMNDFSYLHTNCLELSVFLGCDKFPHQSELANEWEKNREAMLTFMEQVNRGIKGIVKDEQGNPIANATISVEGINHDVTTAPTGDYWRLLNPGEYQVTARAEGYSSMTKLCVVGYEPGATACSFNMAKSNWDRIRQIMALHGNRPIRLSYGNGRTQNSAGSTPRRRVSQDGGVVVPGSTLMAVQRRKQRLRRLRLQKIMKLRAMTTLPPTTTTTLPTTAETTTSWYDSWPLWEGQSSTPGGFTDSLLDYNYYNFD